MLMIRRIHIYSLLIALICFSTFLWYIMLHRHHKRIPSPPTFTYVNIQRPSIAHYSSIDRMGLESYAIPLLMDTLEATDLKEICRRARLLASIQPNPLVRSETSELAIYLEKQLYGFALQSFNSLSNLYRRFMSGKRGIVICTGDHYTRFAVHLIKSLRYFNCTLPVEIFYNGNKDLNCNNTAILESLGNVTCLDIGTFFNVSMKGWDVKPFAVLMSSFSEVLLLDADTVFMRDPSFLFDDRDYLKDGALFFKDRSLFPGEIEKANWIISLFPPPHSVRLQRNRILQAKSQYELESGVVLMDKRRHLYGLLAAVMINCPGPLKKMIREETHGEKETFWIGLEMLNEPYSFMPHPPGSLGSVSLNEEDHVQELCGKLAHFDREGNLLWFNDGIAASKLKNDFFLTELPEITHFARESEGKWKDLCLRECKFHSLNSLELATISYMKDLYRKDNPPNISE